MGQKKTKIMLDTDEIISPKFLNISSTYTSSHSSSSLYFETLSKTKSYLDSALSNDSGCYSEKNNQTSTVSLSSRLQEELHVDTRSEYVQKAPLRKKEKRNLRAQVLCEQINKILEITLAQVFHKTIHRG